MNEVSAQFRKWRFTYGGLTPIIARKPMLATLRVLNVFLASPGDVIAERTSAEEVVTSINKLAKLHGWYIELHRWEDTSPGFGRPQALINPMVDDCDLFVGLLWERWGQPSGQYSSGFEEEYERARSSHKGRGRPEIWLVFKDVDATKLKDAGPQLTKVLEFKEKQIALREVLFRDVRDSNDWKTKLQSWLMEYILRLPVPFPWTQERPTGPTGARPVSESPAQSAAETASQTGEQSAVPRQLTDLSPLLGKAFQSSSLLFSPTEDSPLQEFDVARLFLFSSTLISRRHTNDVLGTHEINLLYKHREQLETTPAEQRQLFRSMIENSGDVKPGWFWFREWSEEAASKALITVALRESSDGVRTGALDLLTHAGIKIPVELWPGLGFLDDSSMVRHSAFGYLGANGDEATLSFLEKLAADDEPMVSSAIKDTRLQILTRLDPNRALSEVIASDEYISEDKLRSLLTRISEVDEQTLVRGTGCSWEQVRKLSVEELARRGGLSSQLAEELTKDPALTVRAIAFQSLAAQGALPDLETVRRALRETDDEGSRKTSKTASLAALMGGRSSGASPDIDSIIVTFYRTQSTEALLAALDWFSPNGHLAYEALALDRFEVISNDLRSDLADGFKRIKDESWGRFEKEYGAEATQKFHGALDKYEELIRSQFTKAALCGLAENAQPQDAALARPYLKHGYSFVQDPAVTVIAKFGNQEDVSVLLEIAKATYGDAANEAAAGALRLSPDPIEVARELLQIPRSKVVKVALSWMYDQDTREIKDVFVELLHGEDEANRVAAAYYLATRLQCSEVEELLEGYIGQDTHYYNVVTWLDRVLYSPSLLKEAFVRKLEQKAC